MVVWVSTGVSGERIQEAKQHVRAMFAYLTGAAADGTLHMHERVGKTELPEQGARAPESTGKRRFIVIPLVVRHRPVFGALQFEGAVPFDKDDLMFANAIANQLAIAIDRHYAWRRDVARRDDAQEEGRAQRFLFEHARRAIRTRERILAVVSHDLRNPLSGIILATHHLAKMQVVEKQRDHFPTDS